MDDEVGGAQLPATWRTAGFAWFAAANVATAGYPMLTIANANLIAAVRHAPSRSTRSCGRCSRAASSARWRCPRPQAGSSLADITTRAEPQDDGTYRLFGTKMWISGGEHELTENIVHLVLAKIPGGAARHQGHLAVHRAEVPGRRRTARSGERNDVVLAGLNHKMGSAGHHQHGAELRRGRVHARRRGRRGRLPGRRAAPRPRLHVPHDERGADRRRHGRGVARLHRLPQVAGVRARAAAGPAGDGKDPATPQVPIIEHADVQRMLLAQKSYVEGGAGAGAVLRASWSTSSAPPSPTRSATRRRCCSTCSPRSPRAGRRSGAWRPTTWRSRCTAATATPASTTSSSTTATTGSTRSTRAPTASRAWTCWAARSPSAAAPAWPSSARRDRGDGRAAPPTGGEAAELGGAAAARRGNGWSTVTAAMFGSGDIEAALANSVVYLEAFGHIVVAWIWLEQLRRRRRPARATSTTASVRPPGTSSASNCPRPPATRPAGGPGPHDAGDARRLVLSAGRAANTRFRLMLKGIKQCIRRWTGIAACSYVVVTTATSPRRGPCRSHNEE